MRRKIYNLFLGVILLTCGFDFKVYAAIKVSDSLVKDSTMCENILKADPANEEVARYVFLNPNPELRKYVQFHLYTCYRLLDKKVRESTSFAKDLVQEYPVLFGDLEPTIHQNTEVIKAAAQGMKNHQFCNLPTLLLHPFKTNKSLKEEIVKINPYCQKYIETKVIPSDSNQDRALIDYYKSFIKPVHYTLRFKEDQKELVSTLENNQEKLLELLKSEDPLDSWFYNQFADSTFYAPAALEELETYPLVNFSQQDLESILKKVESYTGDDPKPKGQPESEAQESRSDILYVDFTLPVYTVYRLNAQFPNDPYLKSLRPRLFNRGTVEKILRHGHGLDHFPQYLDKEFLNQEEIIDLFINNECRIRFGKNIPFWDYLNQAMVELKAKDFFYCLNEYKTFFEKYKFTNNKEFIKDVLRKAHPVFKEERLQLIYEALPTSLKQDSDLIEFFFSQSSLKTIYPNLSISLQQSSRIKLLALKYHEDCRDLVKANPSDKKFLREIFFPEEITHDIEFLFPNPKDQRRPAAGFLSSECFALADSSIRGDKDFVLKLLSRYHPRVKDIAEPAISDPDVIKNIVKRSGQECSELKDSFKNLKSKDYIDISNLNLTCVSQFPSTVFDENFYNFLIGKKIPFSILASLPKRYAFDIKILESIEALQAPEISAPFDYDELIKAREEDTLKKKNQDSEESDQVDSNEEIVISRVDEYRSWYTYAYIGMGNFYNEAVLDVLLSQYSSEKFLSYLENHLPFINFRYSYGEKLFKQVAIPEFKKVYGEFMGVSYSPFLEQSFWLKLSSKIVSEKVSCLRIKKFFEFHSDFWASSAKEISTKLSCVQNKSMVENSKNIKNTNPQ